MSTRPWVLFCPITDFVHLDTTLVCTKTRLSGFVTSELDWLYVVPDFNVWRWGDGPSAVFLGGRVAKVGHHVLLVQNVVDARPVELDPFVAALDVVHLRAGVVDQCTDLKGHAIARCQVGEEHARRGYAVVAVAMAGGSLKWWLDCLKISGSP